MMKTNSSLSTSPIIVIGCHRSGTSYLAEKLISLGVFMGADLNDHKESICFLEWNESILNDTQSTWHDTLNASNVLSNDQTLRTHLLNKIESKLKQGLWWKYIGLLKSIGFLFTATSGMKWGWKDPRNSITLPIWLELFPEARILYVKRDKKAVALSLQKRELSRKPGSRFSAEECKQFDYCIEVSERYEVAIFNTLNKNDKVHVMHIDFDTLIQDDKIDDQIRAFIK